MPGTALVWLRRDLRVHDHPALHRATTEFARAVCVFVVDDALLDGRYRSDARARFMLGCLVALDGELRARGSALVVRHGAPEAVVPALAAEVGAEAVLWTSDVSPYARARDGRVTEALRAAGVRALPHTGAYAIDPSVPRTAGGPYSVFSPFARARRALERRPVLPAPAALAPLPEGLETGRVPAPQELGLGPGVPEPVRAPGEAASRAALDAWLGEGVDHYHERSDGMARIGTSRLAPYLRWGCLSARECEARAEGHGGRGAAAWSRQLAWRDFYAHVLLLRPENVRAEQQERFRELEFEDRPDRLAAWAEGRTGFPLVDAGMRELRATGFMHNRVRLVAGSLLTKELHLDWRAGEDVFARFLLCGEPAQNNGNWQWIAGVGTDPAPFFRRMYNPALHQARFDPRGEYVRRWVPELAGVPDARLGEPWTMSAAEQRAAGCVVGRHYPAPIVDRSVERGRAAERYRRAGAG
jgi:deoxyribodipyrimidine photo-lyase